MDALFSLSTSDFTEPIADSPTRTGMLPDGIRYPKGSQSRTMLFAGE